MSREQQSRLTATAFSGHRPRGVGDLSVEIHGIAPVLGLGFWRGLLAMVIGTVLGALLVAYLAT